MNSFLPSSVFFAETPAAESARPDLRQLAGQLVRDRRASKKWHWRRWLFWILLLGAITAGYLGWHLVRPLPVDTAVVSYQRIGPAANPIFRQSGYVTYPRTATIETNVRFPVVALPAREGERVQAGAVLARLEDGELAAQERLQVVALEDAEATFDRTRRRYEAGTVTDAELQRAQTARENARAALVLTRTQRDQTIIRAPFAGRITDMIVEVGEIAAQGICTIVDESRTLVEVDVNQADIAKITSEQPAVITLEAYPGTEYRGRLYERRAAADQATNTVQVRVEVLDPDDRFIPELSATVFFVDELLSQNQPVEAALAVDTSALVREDAETFVWRVDEGRVTRRPVTTGRMLGGAVEITGGLQENDQVVVNWRDLDLQAHDRVTVQ